MGGVTRRFRRPAWAIGMGHGGGARPCFLQAAVPAVQHKGSAQSADGGEAHPQPGRRHLWLAMLLPFVLWWPLMFGFMAGAAR